MNYPLISEYIEAIRYADDNFDELSNLHPVLDGDGNPVMSSGNFAVVFKMTDGKNDYAIKCFTREQEGRVEAYKLISKELEFLSSPFMCGISFFEKELFVDTKNSAETEFPVLQMDWVEGVTLDEHVRRCLNDKYELEKLAFQFCQMAQWLVSQPFAHGDLKPDNILVKDDGTLVLVDYDGMFVPAMKGEKARELGSPNYRHPLRTEEQFDEHIDDFALASIALSLQAIALNPDLYKEFGAADRLLFSEEDFRNLGDSKLVAALQALMGNADFLRLYELFLIAYSEQSLANVSFRLFRVCQPNKPKVDKNLSTKTTKERLPYSRKTTAKVNFNTNVTKEDLANALIDRFGVKYKKVGRKLLRADLDEKNLNYIIIDGTEIICDEAFSFCESLQNISIPETVKSIGKEAFLECRSLQSITIPDYVSNIGEWAFTLCISLQNISIPNSVTSIGEGAFSHCESLQSIIIPDSVTNIRANTFSGCKSLQSISIPESVTSIDDLSFSECTSLQSITIPNSVTSIGIMAFSKCTSLKSLTIPDSVTNIESQAFEYCLSLQSITISDSVTSIGNMVFLMCKSLKNIYIPRNTKTKFEKLLPDYKDKFVELDDLSKNGEECAICSISSDNIEDLQNNVDKNDSSQQLNGYALKITDEFKDLSTKVTDKELAESLVDEFGVKYSKDGKKLLEAKFSKKINLYIIKKGVVIICDSAFANYKSLQSIIIPDSVKYIGDWAFMGCKYLQNIKIPDSVISIGQAAFIWCSSLHSITIPSSVLKIGCGAFNNCNIKITMKSPHFISDDFIILEAVNNKLISFYKEINSYSIPRTVKIIGDYAFWECSSLKSIKIPNSITSIGEGAFTFCDSLQSINIPTSVTNIENGTFSLCQTLKRIIIPNSIIKIGEKSFSGCYFLQSITIPNSVTQIGKYAFSGCEYLQRITICNSNISIGDEIFNNCNSLQYIYIPKNTKSRFEKLLPQYKDKLVEIDN